jgi:hypothetical protein
VPLAEDTIAPGSRSGIVRTAHGRAGLLICYESCFPGRARALARQGAAFLVVSANDADLGISTIPALHLSMSILRAVETRRSVIHASNAGPSAIIDPHGRLTAHAPLRKKGAVEGCVFEPAGDSLFSRSGSGLARLCQAAAGGLSVAAWRRRRRTRAACRAPGASSRAREARPRGAHLRALGACGLASLALAGANALVVGQRAEPPASPAEVLETFAPAGTGQASPALLSIPAQPRASVLEFLASYLGARPNGAPASEPMSDLSAVARAGGRLGFVTQEVTVGLEELAAERMPVVLALDILGPALALEVGEGGVVLYHESTGLQTVPLAALAQLYRGALLRVRPPSSTIGETAARSR